MGWDLPCRFEMKNERWNAISLSDEVKPHEEKAQTGSGMK